MADPDCTAEDRERWRRVERAREEVIAAAKAYEEWKRGLSGLNLATTAQRLVDSVRKLMEAERPQPRYGCTDSEGPERVIRDNRTGLWLTIAEAVARLNAAEERKP